MSSGNKLYFALCLSLLMDLGQHQQQHSTVHRSKISREMVWGCGCGLLRQYKNKGLNVHTNDVLAVLRLNSRYMFKYSPSPLGVSFGLCPRELPLPKGYISPYIPCIILIQIHHDEDVKKKTKTGNMRNI